VLSEAAYLLRSAPDGARSLGELVSRGILRIAVRLEDALPRAVALIGKYGPQRMDLADACIVVLAERHADCVVLTVDSQFRDVYRRNGRQAIPTLLPAGLRKRAG
jgi:predicted nucleic acid-binding protein